MIKYFAVENFRSIKEQNIAEFDTRLPKDSSFGANPTIGIAGANASGKTSFLQALTFTLWFMQKSFLAIDQDEDIPAEPFVTCQDLPTKLHLIFSQNILVDEQLKDVNFEYILWMTKEEVIKEKLLYYPYKRKRIVYQRDHNKIKQGSTINKLESELWKDLRNNCSVISYAAQFNSQTIAKECKNYQFLSNLNYRGMKEYEFHPSLLEELIDEQSFTKEEIVNLIQIADLGIDGFEITKKIIGLKKKLNDILEKVSHELIETIAPDFIKTLRKYQKESTDIEVQIDNSVDTVANSNQGYINLFFKHKIDDSTENFGYKSESSGTLQFLTLLYIVMIALKYGDLLIIDEIEIKLHQNLLAYIIGLFQNQYENPHGAQLIFSFHNTYFMEILEPSQLWFTEKNDRGYTEIFSAADFKDIRKLQQKNLEELYRLGRFGAKPRGI